MLIYDKKSGKVYSLNTRETAPAAATTNMYNGNSSLSLRGEIIKMIPFFSFLQIVAPCILFRNPFCSCARRTERILGRLQKIRRGSTMEGSCATNYRFVPEWHPGD